MQQRQLRLGDILDDYCPRERRLTNHAIVAMVGAEVKRTRCTTCDAEHEYKHARLPRQRARSEASALQGPSSAPAPKRVAATVPRAGGEPADQTLAADFASLGMAAEDQEETGAAASPGDEGTDVDRSRVDDDLAEGPVHRRLIRATLPRIEGQPPPARPAAEFTIRLPPGRSQRFRPRHQRMDQPFHGYRSDGGGGNPQRSGGPRQNGSRAAGQRPSNRRGPGRRRQK